ncbi:CRISPR-associated helicase/endonuclease Cas3 [Paenibacillus sp. RUD330]|uniref:CRISPR-associated helicase/endonuclease Cas3 n=1 Tax=Paenibacillus sp. RUD330 TaxID=2023772 RepID=UPI000B9258E1|nr:CRISPR-associated helicase/endonuclease Cas3 [Paenibacillus sp. RUD330]ASS67081.1 CRISPR-associated helicase/endonuclease Cas3 [Paenibacillus sp. RUD330]
MPNNSELTNHPEFVAHIRQMDGQRESVHDHLLAVQQYAEKLGAKIGAKHLAGLSGLLHDVGKNTIEFKTYIESAVANPHDPPRRGSVDHSTAGGKWLFERFHLNTDDQADKRTTEWIANCILSHHGGLKDYLDPEGNSPFLKRIETPLDKLPGYDNAIKEFLSSTMGEAELDAYFEKARGEMQHLIRRMKNCKPPSITASLTVKYLFSCLIDADRTKTRQFEEEEEDDPVFDSYAFFTVTYRSLLEKMDSFRQADDADHPINRLRNEMSKQCDDFAVRRPSGIYTLSIPTGGGKTLASFRYALRHAIETGKERIVYVLPYTTIIEQNVAELRKIVQNDDMILEYHSNVAEDFDVRKWLDPEQAPDEEDEDQSYDLERKKLRLARDTWDRPIIFTTMVQFLNTFYAKGSRNARRLHQLANAVVIFDEVQAVPSHCISLFNGAVNFLHGICGSTVVLCTATQPALQQVRRNVHLSSEPEMICNPNQVMKQFKRVELRDVTDQGAMTTEQLAAFVSERMADIDSLLIILNTKAAVRKLFDFLKAQEWMNEEAIKLYHLSTFMCPAHRKDSLDAIRNSLRGKERIICISTQLIEAGVDISFQGVIRSLAGLDSIAQAAGRCNRHGKDSLREVYIIQSAEESLRSLPEIKLGAEQTERLLGDFRRKPECFDNQLLSIKAMDLYFSYYYDKIKEKMDYPVSQEGFALYPLLDLNSSLCNRYKDKHNSAPPMYTRSSIATVERHFEAISNTGKSVIVPYNDDASEIILALNGELRPNELGDWLRKAQPYTVSLYDQELRKLDKGGNLNYLFQGRVMALNETAYSKEYGVDPAGNGEFQLAII